MGRRIEVEPVSSVCVLIRGYGSRELITEVRGRPPVWAVRDRAWVVQPSTADDVQALAESRGYDVAVLGHPAPLSWRDPDAGSSTAVDIPEVGLW